MYEGPDPHYLREVDPIFNGRRGAILQWFSQLPVLMESGRTFHNTESNLLTDLFHALGLPGERTIADRCRGAVGLAAPREGKKSTLASTARAAWSFVPLLGGLARA